MVLDDICVRVMNNPADFGFAVTFYYDRRERYGMVGVGMPIVFNDIKHGEQMPPPTICLSKDQLVKLMDELWRNGIRPSSGEGNVGQIGAIQCHLEDMRKIVFESRGILRFTRDELANIPRTDG